MSGDLTEALLPPVRNAAWKMTRWQAGLLALLMIAVIVATLGFSRLSWLTAVKHDRLSVILTADPGGMVGLSERSVLEAALEQSWVEPSDIFFCERVLHGLLFGQPVLLVTTGIGHDHASICMSDLLRVFEGRFKDIFFLGVPHRCTWHHTLLTSTPHRRHGWLLAAARWNA